MNKVSVTILGIGSWGTALGLSIVRNGHITKLWGHNPQTVALLANSRVNYRYLPGIKLPLALMFDDHLPSVVSNVDLIILAVPSCAYREVLAKLRPYLPKKAGLLLATKGINNGQFIHEITQEYLGIQQWPIAILSGPSFAREVALNMPTAVTIAANDQLYANWVANILHSPNMRTYTSNDIIGVAVGGVIKNVIAIATGISDGLGFGANTRAALISRGLAEMARFVLAAGGQSKTLMGLSGVGDLVLTCTDNQSRNRRFGIFIGKGKTLTAALAAIGQTVEGVLATKEILLMAQKYQVDMPIIEQVNQVIYYGKNPTTAVRTLLARQLKTEFS